MIAKIKKALMVMQTKDKLPALDSLGELGLVHLDDFQCSSPEAEAASNELKRAQYAYFILAEFKTKRDAVMPSSDPRELTEIVLGLHDKMDTHKGRLIYIEKKMAELENWGDFDPEDFNFLAQRNWFVKIYTAHGEKLKNIPIEDAIVLQRSKNSAVFAHVTRDPDRLEGFEEFIIPEKRFSALIAERNELLAQIDEYKEKLTDCYALRSFLRQYMMEMEKELEYQLARANVLEEGSLTAIVGYIPEDQSERLKDWAGQNSVALAVSDPAADDPVPTLVRNPKWLKVVEPVFDFLNIVPGYNELNVSFFFLLFFIIFFAMIVGDAVYGIIFMLGGLFAILISLVKRKKPPLIGYLFVILGLGTVGWGAINGAWFGAPELIEGTLLEKLVIPRITKGINVYNPFGELYQSLSGQDIIMLLCFGIGLVQLTIAQIWNFLRKLTQHSLQALAELGWVCVNFGLFYLVLSMVMYFDLDEVFATHGLLRQTSIVLILGGVATVLLFGFQESNLIKGFFGGLRNLLPTALDAVSAFGDIISYIRLFAVGLAGAEIARSFNVMAGGLLEGHAIIPGILILLLGHTLNFILCCLGVLVHGIRLNVLEFSGRLGLEWSGHSFKPFQKPVGLYAATQKVKAVFSSGSTVSDEAL